MSTLKTTYHILVTCWEHWRSALSANWRHTRAGPTSGNSSNEFLRTNNLSENTSRTHRNLLSNWSREVTHWHTSSTMRTYLGSASSIHMRGFATLVSLGTCSRHSTLLLGAVIRTTCAHLLSSGCGDWCRAIGCSSHHNGRHRETAE